MLYLLELSTKFLVLSNSRLSIRKSVNRSSIFTPAITVIPSKTNNTDYDSTILRGGVAGIEPIGHPLDLSEIFWLQ